MVGQEKLLDKINNYTITTLPKTLLLIGEQGCGKKTVAAYIKDKFNFEYVEVNSVDLETLVEYQQTTINTLYLIDLDNFTQKQQNQFLKFIEEPSKTNYIILIASTENNILETIKARCSKLYFQEYTADQLKQIKFVSNNDIYKVCRTPGQLENIDEKTFDSLVNLCKTIIEKISKATFANTLSIATKINYKEEYDKYDFELFFKILINCLKEKYIESKDEKYLAEYLFVNNYFKDAQIKTLNKENFMLNFLANYKNLKFKIV